jgi:phosphate-selective porin OprO/OprP
MSALRHISIFSLAPVAVAVSLGWAIPAHAQSAEDVAALRQEMAAMRQTMEAMATRINTLEGQLADASAKADAAGAAAASANTTALAARDASKSMPKVSWKGGPEFEGEGGWSFKPRGRIQVDAGHVSAPGSINDAGLGFGNEVRRARLGVEGTVPGGFGYRFEADFAEGDAQVTDAFLSYNRKALTVTVGQHNNFQSLEELTSSLNTSFMERAAFTDAFGFERRVGLSAQYAGKQILVQAGVFTDNIHDLDDENNSWGADGRIVYMPKLGETQLHLGASGHYRQFKDVATTARYRQRPFIHTSDTRFIDTGSFGAKSETGYGLEAAAIRGPFHFAGEAFWQKVNRPGLGNPTFFGGYAEVGYFLTGGDTRGYKRGAFDRVKPKNGFDKGGIGAIQVNLRYDYLDLSDAGIVGGTQNGYAVSVIWTPATHVRLMANYGKMDYSHAAIPTATGDRDYSVDAFGMRAQFDF